MGRTYSNHTEWKGKKQNKVTVKVRKKKDSLKRHQHCYNWLPCMGHNSHAMQPHWTEKNPAWQWIVHHHTCALLCIQGGGPARTMLWGKGNPLVKPNHWHLQTDIIRFWFQNNWKREAAWGSITDWAKIRELKVGAENLRNIASWGAIRQVNGKAEALRNHNNFARWN